MTGLAKVLRFTRGLRFRLAFSYVFFFTILLVLPGVVFRQTLSTTFTTQMDNVLQEEWGAAKGYLRTGETGPNWFYDVKDPDESFTVERLRRVYMLADPTGRPLQYSAIYHSIGLDSSDEVRAILNSGTPATRVARDGQGIPYMIRSGLMVDERGNKYYLAIGRAINHDNRVIHDFTRNYFSLLPALIALIGLLGWLLAGRELGPLNSAQRTTNSK